MPSRACSRGKFVVPRPGEAYDARVGGPNREFGLNATGRTTSFQMRRLWLLAPLLLPMVAFGQSATVNWTDVHQEIDGFGASDESEAEELTTAQAAFFFGTGTGDIGLSLLRTGVPDNSPDGDIGNCITVNSGCVGLYVADMQLAIPYGVRVWSTAWSPPPAYMTNGSIVCTAGSGSGALISGDYSAYATWLANYVESLKTFDGISLYALSVQNEPDICPPYGGALMSAAEFDTFIKTNLGPTFSSDSLSTLIMMPEPAGFYDFVNYADTCMGDSSCYNYVGINAWHDYDATYTAPDTVNSLTNPYSSLGKKFWETEVSAGDGFGPSLCTEPCFDPSMANALMWAAIIDNRIAVANANAWNYWWLINYYSGDDEGLIGGPGNNEIARRAYVLGNYAMFVRPGYYRIDATHVPHSGVTVSAYQNVSGGNLVIVATNQNGTSVPQTFSITNAPTFTFVTPYITSASLNLAAQSNVSVSSNSFTYTLPADSVTTFVGTLGTPAATPIISPASGSYTSPQIVSMTCSTSTPTMYYTTDGSLPTDSSTVYTGPFSQSIPATVEAICGAGGFTNSSVATNLYALYGTPAVLFSSTSLNFGSQSTGTWSPSQTITLQNTGSATLGISLPIQITGTNAADFVLTTSSAPCPASLGTGLSCQINVAFAPTATGSRSANVSITDNATGSPQTVALSGTGGAGVSLWTHVGTATPVDVNSGTTCVVTVSPALVAGETIWVGVTSYNGTATPSAISTINDGNGNSFTITPHSPSVADATDAGASSLAYMLSAPTNINSTITVTFASSLSGADAACFADSFQVASGYTPTFDTDAAGSGSSAAISTPSIAPATSNELLYSVAAPGNSIQSAGGIWVLPPNAIVYPGTPETPADGTAAAYATNVSSALAVSMAENVTAEYDSMEGAIEAAPVPSTPTITSLSATSGNIGATFTITGTNFGATQGSSAATLNESNLTINSWSATSIGVTVPSGGSTGNVIVTVSSMSSNGVLFTVTPNLSSLSVSSGPVGTSVTVAGTGFGSSQGSSTLVFNGANCSPTSWSTTSIVCKVPAAATTGNVVATVGGYTSNGIAFTVTPYITGLSPTSGPVGAQVTISGTTFGSSQGSSTVTFNGISATCSTWSASSLSCTVPTTTTGNVVVTVSSQASNGVSFTVSPTISSVSPTSGITGSTVTITGTNFGSSQGTSKVTFNGVTCSVTTWSAASITCPVPSGATTGSVIVTVSGDASNGVSFTVTPHITSLSPTSGPGGTKVTISGTTFGSSQGSSTVMFDNATATCSSWTATSLSCTVPTTTTGNVVVTVSGQASNGVSFTVTASPTISSVSPTSGITGATVTITGTNFGSSQGTSTVTFNGVTCSVKSWSATSVTCPVPSKATTGSVIVTVSGDASNGVSFTVTPHITSLSPTSGRVGNEVTISGTTFGSSQGSSTVTFNRATATCSSWTTTSLSCTVPTTTTGNVVVTVSGQTSNGVDLQ